MIDGWLTGWKRIAAYIDKSIKTAKRYHKNYHMPIHRGPGNIPHGLPLELDIWIREFGNLKDKK